MIITIFYTLHLNVINVHSVHTLCELDEFKMY